MELTVEGPKSGQFRWTVVVDGPRREVDLRHRLEVILDECDGGDMQLWVRSVDPDADRAVSSMGFERYRDLWQLRCPLPNEPAELVTRPFVDADIDDFLMVNGRAFAWHPEQGALDRQALDELMAQAWFNPEGLRLHFVNEQLAGFCWTKIHAATEPPLGEIYVIAVDPAHHGRGLGKPMTRAGLDWLSAQGLRHAMLYVESDNDPANATYAAIGFTRHHTDRAYELRLS